jgi:hypothetical protein
MYTKKMSFLAVVFLIVTIFTQPSCTSNEIAESKDVAQDKIYQSYSVTYDEGDANAIIFCQYRFGGKNGTTLVLNTPSQLSIDGEKLAVDSNSMSGAFYRTTKPIANFWGNHTIVFTNVDKKQYQNNFSFESFKVNFPTTASKNEPLNINFTTSLGADDYVEINSTNSDSSFSVTNSGTMVTIPMKELKRQPKKEVVLQANLYRNIPLKENTTEGGSIYIHYKLKPVKVNLQ